MRSRAVRRLQEPARWVPEASQAMLFAPWAPHQNLPGRPRLQRPKNEEPIKAETWPTFIETPTATPKQKNKPAEKFVSLPGDAEGSAKPRAPGWRFPRAQSQPGPSASSSSSPADTSMHVLGPQILKSARQLPPAERQDSIQKRQRPAEVNTVLMIAVGLQRKRDRIWDSRAKTSHTAETEGVSWTSSVVKVVDAITTSPRDTLGKSKTAAGRM